MRNCSFFSASRLRLFLTSVILFASASLWSPVAEAAKIHAERGRTYALTSKHGPWMISVTSLWGGTPEQEEQASRAASELVYMLRRKGIPAYIYKQNDQLEEIESVDRQGRAMTKKFVAQQGMIGVLAGNYKSIDDESARQTLNYIKKLELKVKLEWHGQTKEWPLFTAKAFLTPNPLLPPSDQMPKHHDPLILKLNSGDHTLLQNKGKYTVVVASFYGQSSVKPEKAREFERMLSQKNGRKVSLDNAARDSWELMQMLRSKNVHGGPYDAYVYHDRFSSIVTIGAFNSKDDPQIDRLIQIFKAKEAVDPNTKKTVTVSESIQIPSAKKGAPPRKAWALDPDPRVIEVPR